MEISSKLDKNNVKKVLKIITRFAKYDTPSNPAIITYFSLKATKKDHFGLKRLKLEAIMTKHI